MGSFLSKHDQQITSPITKFGFNQTGKPAQSSGQKFIKMRMYRTVIPQIQKKLGQSQVSQLVRLNHKIQRQLFWSSMISFTFATVVNLALLKRERISFYKTHKDMRFPFIKLLKYLPLSFVLLTASNYIVFHVFEKTSSHPAEISNFLDKNEVALNQIVKERYGHMINTQNGQIEKRS